MQIHTHQKSGRDTKQAGTTLLQLLGDDISTLSQRNTLESRSIDFVLIVV